MAAYVQGAGGTAWATSIAVTYPGNVTVGNLLVVAVGVYQKQPASGDLSDSLGNTWTLESVTYGGSPGWIGSAVYTAIANAPGACTVTFNDADSVVDDPLSMVVSEFSGVTQTPDGKATAADNATGTTDAHHGNVGQTTAGIYYGVTAQVTGNVACTPDVAWDATVYNNGLGGTYPGLCVNYSLAAPGVYNQGWTYGAGVYWNAHGITFPGTVATSTGKPSSLQSIFRFGPYGTAQI